MSNLSYLSLIKILDGIRRESPKTVEFSRYSSPDPNDVEFSRGQAFIHLFLSAKFGVEDFQSRHEYICEGSGDGGLDAYYIDEENHLVYLIQSKFKASSSAFRSNETSAVELNKMSVEQIIGGKDKDVTGTSFNEKVIKFQRQFYEVKRKSPYECKVVFLANVADMTDEQLRRFTSDLDYEIYNYDRSYVELVKRVCSATYYDAQNIKVNIPINLLRTDGKELCKTINTTHGKVELSAYFAPTLEIGKLMSLYKNAILEYNPRNYLGLSEKKDSVNPQIRDTILKHDSVNDFALLNNGITIFATSKKFSKETGVEDTAFLYITNPQIINGGQTAYTLSELYSAYQNDLSIFEGKEVLVRVIVPIQNENQNLSKEHRLRLIESVSYSTNSQTPIKEPDKRSNSVALHKIQDELFRKYGRLLEVKKEESFLMV